MPNPVNGVGRILAQAVVPNTTTVIYGPVEGINTQVEIRGLVFNNESSSATTVTYGAGKSGSTAGAAGTSQGKTVPLGAAGASTAIVDCTELEGIVLGVGDYVWASAGASSAVAVLLDGVVY
jgi:hypothetical protein